MLAPPSGQPMQAPASSKQAGPEGEQPPRRPAAAGLPQNDSSPAPPSPSLTAVNTKKSRMARCMSSQRQVSPACGSRHAAAASPAAAATAAVAAASPLDACPLRRRCCCCCCCSSTARRATSAVRGERQPRDRKAESLALLSTPNGCRVWHAWCQCGWVVGGWLVARHPSAGHAAKLVLACTPAQPHVHATRTLPL